MAEKTVLDSKKAQENWDAFTRAWHNGHRDYIAQAERFNDFYLGDQWDDADKQKLESLKRPALTLNQILQVINAIIGHYGETRADVQFKPRRGPANAALAHVMTRLADHIFERNRYTNYVEPRVFEDGIIEDRGYIDVRMDFTDNLLGEVAMKPLDPRAVIPDPDSDSYDPADWKQVMVVRWMTLDDVEANFGKAARRKVESVATEPGDTFGENSIKYQSYGAESAGHSPVGDKTVQAVRTIERQYRKMARVQELVDLETGHTRTVPETWEEGRAEAVAEQFGLGLRHRVKSRIRWTVSVDQVVLHDSWSPYDNFTVVPYFPIYRRGRPSGLVRHLMDPQEQLNKIESQILHTINTTANSGWTAEAGSLVNMTEQELEERGAETGLVIIHGRNRPAPQKILPNQPPTGLEHFASKSGDYIHNIPGASALLGHNPPSSVSGVALDRAQNKALLGLQIVFNNMDFTRQLVAMRVMDCIQTFYTEHRVFHVTDWRDPEQAEEEIEINYQAAGTVANDITVGAYDVVATSSPTRDTFEDMQFAQILELRNAGVQIPDHYVILASQLSGKERIAEQVKQMQGLGEPTEEQLMIAQLQVEQLQAEVAEIQARAEELNTRAQHNMARAAATPETEQREQWDMAMKYRMEMERLKADMQKKSEELTAKIEIAKLHSTGKEGLTRFNTAMKGLESGRDRAAGLQKEALRGNFALQQEAMKQRQQRGEEDTAARSKK